VRFFVLSDPEELIFGAMPLLQAALDRRVSPHRPKVSRGVDANYVTIELDGDLSRPPPGTAGADEEVIAAVEESLPPSIGLLIWLEMSEQRSTMLFIRANDDDADATGESYIRPY
jgi:hypothetical protein